MQEKREWRVDCRRQIVRQCEVSLQVQANDEITSLQKAEQVARSRGWILHANGDATCPTCYGVWMGAIELQDPGTAFENGERGKP